MSIKGEQLPDLPSLITQMEDAIGTPVQTAVKREDEQAFAKLNAENLLFCEDAARRLKHALEQKTIFTTTTLKLNTKKAYTHTTP